MEVLTPIVLAGGGTGGGGGTPGGSDTQVQFNDGGAFGGDAGLTYDDTNGSLSVGGKTVTASEPVLDLSQTWNNAATAFTGLKFNATNAASASNSKLLDLQVGGTSLFKVNSSGAISVPLGSKTNAGISFGNANEGFYDLLHGFAFSAPTNMPVFAARYVSPGLNNLSQYWGLGICRDAFLAWGSRFDATQNHDLAIGRDAAGTLAQRNGTNAQTYRLYNTYTDASNYERGFLQWNSNVLEIGSEGAGTGSEQPVRITAATLKLPNLPTYADNTAATSGGLVAGDVYQTATGELRITV